MIVSFYIFLAILCPTFAVVFAFLSRRISNDRGPRIRHYYSDEE